MDRRLFAVPPLLALLVLDEDVDVVWLDEPEFDATALPAGAAATSLVIPRAPLD